MVKIYGIPNCDTVKKATNWLGANGVVYEFHDYKKKGISEQKITEWLGQHPWEKLINRAGTTWKKLSDQQKAAVVDNATATELMAEHTSLIKRPLLETDRILALGFDATEYAKIFVNLKPL